MLMVGLVLRFWRSTSLATAPRRSAASSASPRRVHLPAARQQTDWADWLADRSQSGGTAVDLLIHDFDQMNWLLGTPRSVYASGKP